MTADNSVTPGTSRSGSFLSQLRAVLEVTALMATIAVCIGMLVIMWRGPAQVAPAQTAKRAATPSRGTENVIPVEPASLEGAQIEGNRAAKVAVIEYSDFQCPFCARFATETLPAFEKAYVEPGKVMFAFRQFPLESIHANALEAAKAAECAGEQGQFWALHALTFADPLHLDQASLRARALKTGVDAHKFEECLEGEAIQRVRADEETGRLLLVSGTPTFFLGKVQPDGRVKILKRLAGAVPFSQFKTTLDEIIGTPITARVE
jgi:protein-disulfide isomerase